MKVTISIPNSAEKTLRELDPVLSESAMKAVYKEFLESWLEEEEYYPPSQFELWLEGDDAEDVLAKYVE